MGGIDGSDSGDELARILSHALPSVNDVRDDIASMIDKKNYIVTVDADRGLAITFWGGLRSGIPKMALFRRADKNSENIRR